MISLDLSGRVAVVTGAGQGIGRVVARRLAEAGAAVMLTDRRPDTGQAVTDELRRAGHPAAFVAADLAVPEQLEGIVRAAVDAFGALDIVVNNARPPLPREPFPASLESWDTGMDVLLKAPAQLVALALPYLQRSGLGSVVNMASTNAFLISQQPLTYHVAKAAIVQLTRHLACELGPRGIRVNAVCPGLMDLEDRAKKLTDVPAQRTVVETIVPLGRAGGAADVAALVVFLCSDLASYLTGQALVLDGGVSLSDQFACSMRAAEALGGREGEA